MEKLDGEPIRKKVITLRKTTTTRQAIRITIQQGQNKSGEITMPTISISVNIPLDIESPRFAKDLGEALIIAAHYADEWAEHVK